MPGLPNDFRLGPCVFWAVLTKLLGLVRPEPLWTLQVGRPTVVRSTLGINKNRIYCSSTGRWRGLLVYRLRLGFHSQIKPSRLEPVVARRNRRCFAPNESGAPLIQRNWLAFKTGPHSQTYLYDEDEVDARNGRTAGMDVQLPLGGEACSQRSPIETYSYHCDVIFQEMSPQFES